MYLLVNSLRLCGDGTNPMYVFGHNTVGMSMIYTYDVICILQFMHENVHTTKCFHSATIFAIQNIVCFN